MKYIKFINNIEKYIIVLTIILYPLFIGTWFVNLFETPKLILLFSSVVLLLITKTIKLAFYKDTLTVNTTQVDLSIVIFTFFYLISGFVNNINKIDMFLYPANASLVLLSVILFFLVNQHEGEDKELFTNSLLISGFLIAVTQIVSIFGIIKLIPFLPEVVKTEVFTPFGNILGSIIFTVVLIPILVKKFFQKVDISEKILSGLVTFIFLTNIFGSIYLLLPNKETSIKILNLKTSWSLAVDALKINPFLGAGPTNFSHVFNKYRPIEYNSNQDWQIKYIQGTSLALTILTETGMLGFISLLFFLYKALQKTKLVNPAHLGVVIFIIGIITLPISFISLPIFMIFLSLKTETDSKVLFRNIKKQVVMPVYIVSILSLVSILFFGYRLIYAEYLFAQSVKMVGQNQGVEAYKLINKSIQISPYSDRYHLYSSIINLALAEALATKSDIDDNDKTNISRLVQQSIREGKAAVAVGYYKSANWESLSDIYQRLIAFAKGADTFAIESLNQAINLDPINPLLRIKLGGLYYAQQKYDLAAEAYKLAILAKPDLPNSHYNLAIVYKKTGQLDKAKEEMNKTLSLLGKESQDYDKALKELQDIEELSKPTEKPEPIIEPQIELPAEKQ